MNDITAGFTVNIYFPSGKPEGLRFVGKSNWIGQGLVFPRALLAEACRQKELGYAGVYVLWGPGESDELPLAYVGESDVVKERMKYHAKERDFWTHAVVFTSKDQSLNKAHVQYLEARLAALASEAKRCELDHAQVPRLRKLSKPDEANAESFLADLLLCLDVLGVNFFKKAEATTAIGRDLQLKGKGIKASGIDSAEGFVVRAGSTAVKSDVKKIHKYLAELRRVLVDKGVLTDAGEVYRLPQDYIFNSPSRAASVILGRAANGRIEWQDSKGRTLKEIQEEEANGA